MKRIFYLGYYNLPDSGANFALSAVNKMDYIIGAVESLNMSVNVVSATTRKDGKKAKGEIKKIGKNSTLKTFGNYLGKSKISRFIGQKRLKRELKKYLKENIKPNDTVIIYHSLGYCDLYKWIYEKLKANVILEIEEIYTDVVKQKHIDNEQERKTFEYANGYIFPTELLDKSVNTKGKPSAVIYGTYKNEKRYEKIFNDGKTHVVYAGIFDPNKGVITAVDAACFLNGNYHIHILGFGKQSEIDYVKRKIEETAKKTDAEISYDGLLSGEEYIRFIQSCDIGLSTQNPDAQFNATSFPSKILSYMSNGLRIVSVRIPAIEKSAVGEYIHYYDEQTPESIAAAVMSGDFNDGYDSRKKIAELDKTFTRDLKVLLGEQSEKNYNGIAGTQIRN